MKNKCKICGGEIITTELKTYGEDMNKEYYIKIKLTKCKDCNSLYNNEIVDYKVKDIK